LIGFVFSQAEFDEARQFGRVRACICAMAGVRFFFMVAFLGLGMIGGWALQFWKDGFELSTTRIRRCGR
jgi:hypothetical protein